MTLNSHIFLSLTDLAGILAAIMGLSSGLQKIQKYFKLQIGASSYIWAIHFFLLGGITEGLVQIGIGTRTWVSIYLKKSVPAIATYLIVTSTGFLSVMYLTWQGPSSILPAAAAINSTVAYLFGNIQMRLMFLFSSICWIVRGIYLPSYPVVATESIGICIGLLGIWRVMRDKKMGNN